MAVDERSLTELTTGLDALEVPLPKRTSRGRKLWRATWPKVLATAIVLGIWQFLYSIEWKPHYAFPSPDQAIQSIFDNGDVVWQAVQNTLYRAVYGYAIALVIGVTVGALVARIPVLRAAIGSMITGLQTMPSVAWVPLAIILFHQGQGVIMFVVVLGAAPSIANGIIDGIDHVPPILLRAGRVLGARGFTSLRLVVIPAALPSVVSGLKQGWAFAWRSLMAAELFVSIIGQISIGQLLETDQSNLDFTGASSIIIVILVIGIVVDTIFTKIDLAIRRRRGLLTADAIR
jgi:NitT/TauT family transport system permease protein